MYKLFSYFIFLCTGIQSYASSPVTTIKGTAAGYVGKSITVFAFEDYLSQVKTKIASSKVDDDSTFKISFFNEETRKFRIEIGKNYFFIYVQPGANYNLDVSRSSPYLDENLVGVEAGFFFLDLDTADINYKILVYDDFQLGFLERNYNHKSLKSTRFVAQLDTFKMKVEDYFKADTNLFLKVYIKYSIASLDDLAFLGQRNKFEKYDFYIKSEPVWYQNDRYMDYINHFYQRYEAELSNEITEEFYRGITRSSPTYIMNALGGDYALRSLKIRELVMIKMLSEVFYSGEYSQTNIITILDSLGNHALFNEHKVIAKNIRYRLLDLQPGTVMPDFNLIIDGERKYKNDYTGKHVYIQFVNKGITKSIEDLKLLSPLYQKYAKHIEFITVLVCEKDDLLLEDPTPFIKEHHISWDFSVISEDDSMLKKFDVTNFPKYLLIDAAGYVVSSPALTPRPNNEYETIEKNFFNIARYYRLMEKQE